MRISSSAVSEPTEFPRPAERDRNERLVRLVANHYDFVWRVLRRLGVPASATEDAAQEVFIVVDRKAREFWPQNERSYLFAVAMRVAAAKRRAEKQVAEPLTQEALSEIADATPGPDEMLDDRRARAAIDQILDLIPFEQRVVFVLFELEDMTMQEISVALDIPSGTVASRLRRAREIFQQAVQRLQSRTHNGGRP